LNISTNNTGSYSFFNNCQITPIN